MKSGILLITIFFAQVSFGLTQTITCKSPTDYSGKTIGTKFSVISQVSFDPAKVINTKNFTLLFKLGKSWTNMISSSSKASGVVLFENGNRSDKPLAPDVVINKTGYKVEPIKNDYDLKMNAISFGGNTSSQGDYWLSVDSSAIGIAAKKVKGHVSFQFPFMDQGYYQFFVVCDSVLK